MFSFSMEACEELAIENHILAAKFMDFLGRCRYTSSSYFLSDSLNAMDLYLGNHLSLFSFFFILLLYHLLFFRGWKKSSVWGGEYHHLYLS
jgi:hypothetical protein